MCRRKCAKCKYDGKENTYNGIVCVEYKIVPCIVLSVFLRCFLKRAAFSCVEKKAFFT